jgi:phage tail sheath gpL-like
MANLGTLTINVPNYPNSNRTPGTFVGIDNSNANTASPLLKTLIIGQITSAGTAVPNVPVVASSPAQVQTLCGGPGSMLALQYAAYVGDDSFGSITLLPLADAAGSVASVSSMTITGPATASGSLPLYVAGQIVSVAVTSGDTASVIASNVMAAVNLLQYLPCTASVAAGIVTFTAKNAGLAAGDIDLRMAYRGSIGGENMPLGVSVAFGSVISGATDPTLTTALANIAASSFRFIVMPYSSGGQVASMVAMLSDATGAWSPLNNYGGHAFSAYRGTFAGISTYGITNNFQHISVLGLYNSPTPVFQQAASFTAVVAASVRDDPALPLTAVTMQGILAPPTQSRFTRTMRNTLLYDGISTTKANSAGQVILERAITTYQTNALGVPDNSYLNVEVMFTLQALVDLLRAAFTTKYARVKLVDNGTTIVPGSNTVNPNSIASECIAQYQIAANQGLVQGVAAFAAAVNVQKVSPSQVNIYFPAQVADQLFEIAVDLAFTQ